MKRTNILSVFHILWLLLLVAAILADTDDIDFIDDEELNIRSKRGHLVDVGGYYNYDYVKPVCRDGDPFPFCICYNETMKCENARLKGLGFYLHTAKIGVRDISFILKVANFKYCSFGVLKKDEILPNHKKAVEQLRFPICGIRKIEDGAFDGFTALIKLDLSENVRLQTIDEKVLSAEIGSTLLELDLSKNKFTNLPMSVFTNLHKLSVLNLTMNNGIVLSTLQCGKNVSIFPEALSNLKILDLSANNLTNFDDGVFINLKNLEKLYIGHNNILTIPKAFKTLSNLQHLDLSFAKLSVINDCEFRNFSSLKHLNLAFNEYLSNIHANAFGAITNGKPIQLAEFSIRYCNVSVLSEKLLNWKNVSSIDIEYNPIECNCSMAWLINDYNATNPLYVNKLKNSSGFLYKNEMKCYSPLNGIPMHSLSGGFCMNEIYPDNFIVSRGSNGGSTKY